MFVTGKITESSIELVFVIAFEIFINTVILWWISATLSSKKNFRVLRFFAK